MNNTCQLFSKCFLSITFFRSCFHIFFHLCKDAESLVDGLVELVLFLAENFYDKISLLFIPVTPLQR